MLKILHLSDLHIGTENLGARFQNMVTELIKLEKGENYVVVITGDIIDDYTIGGALEEAKEQIDRIKNAGFHVLIAPGNHDCGDYRTIPVSSKEGMKKFKTVMYSNPSQKFPQFEVIEDIAFIGLDSMEGELEKQQGYWADGEIGKAQLKDLEKLLKEEKVTRCDKRVVYLHHHPFTTGPWYIRWWRAIFHGLDDAKQLKKILKSSNIDALLFGHNHVGKAWNGKLGIKHVYDAGSSTGKGDKKVDNKKEHRLIDLSKPIDDSSSVSVLNL